MKDLSWKTLSSEYLYKNTWFTVRKDTCETPDGKIVTPYYVYEFPTWVSAVAFTEDGRVLLERQYRHALQQTDFELPGGCVDDTDPSLQAAIARELMEETGFEFTRYQYLGKTSANPSTNNNWMHMWMATGGKKIREQQLDHNEDIEVYAFTIDEVKQLIREGRIIQSMHVTAIFYAFTALNEIRY